MEEIIMQQTENKKSVGRFSSELFGWGESLMAVLVFFVVVFTFFVRLIGVDCMSMYPCLLYTSGRCAGFCRMDATRVTSWLSTNESRCLPLYSVQFSGPN